MPTMVDDEVLGHTLGNGKTMVLLNQSQREIDAGSGSQRGIIDRCVRPLLLLHRGAMSHMVESRMGAVAWAFGHRPVSHPRSSVGSRTGAPV